MEHGDPASLEDYLRAVIALAAIATLAWRRRRTTRVLLVAVAFGFQAARAGTRSRMRTGHARSSCGSGEYGGRVV